MLPEDLRPCDTCGGQMLQSPMAGYKLTRQRMVEDRDAINRLGGMTQFFGGGAGGMGLATVFEGHSDLFLEPAELKDEFMICEECATRPLRICELEKTTKSSRELRAEADAK